MLGDAPPAQLGVQLAASAGLVVSMTVVHGVGLVATSRLLRLRKDRLREWDFGIRAVLLLAGLGLAVFTLHIVEILLFSLFYLAVGAIGSIEEALFYSASAYATLGRTADYFPADWRLIGAIEALVGFVLIGWSTAFMVSTLNRIRE
ncbi:hypothetical protein E2493_20320 [Sphingomonas parva]|uniref:Two pore domain potassium channel family protein n=1 Tax=Sphingomonas parva TaxID=2555898 RepID=A0A4Y8ZMN3_9SPHN|nr:hypothetical protein [Sphingomonas parva]TFI56415.1 hypothetical protein E2493_20320 [Sphingomonas parva]